LKSDGREGAADGQDRVEIGDLAVWIEESDEEQSSERAGDRPRQDFEGNKDWPSRAAMIVREMPFTARTRGHRSENEEAATR
jgi:hypothetical protein